MEKETAKKKTVNRLLFTENIHRDYVLRHEIIEACGHKFRIIMDIHNGSTKHDTQLSILLPNGTWGFVVNAVVLNIELMNYVAADDKWRVNATWDRVRKTFIDYINVVYA